MVVDTEDKYKKWEESRGSKVLHNGYPDFFVIPKDGQPYFVEVKSGLYELGENQTEMIAYLKERYPVYISRDGEPVDLVANNLNNNVPEDIKQTGNMLSEYRTGFYEVLQLLSFDISRLKQEKTSITKMRAIIESERKKIEYERRETEHEFSKVCFCIDELKRYLTSVNSNVAILTEGVTAMMNGITSATSSLTFLKSQESQKLGPIKTCRICGKHVEPKTGMRYKRKLIHKCCLDTAKVKWVDQTPNE